MESIGRIAACLVAVTVGAPVFVCVAGAAGTRETAAVRESGTEPATAPSASCTTSGCHLEVTQYSRPHAPVSANQCDVCHEPLEGATPFQPGARHEFKHASDNPELCYGCHDRLAEVANVHEPVKMGVCVLCHDPHGAEHASLLRVDVDRTLCAQCHRTTFDQGDHVHAPVKRGTCGACHDPHGSDHKKNLRIAPPDLCLDCHDTIEELLDEATVTHDALTAERSCLGCHDPHVSGVARLLVAEQTELCLSCHDRELDSGDGTIRNMAQYLQEHANHHGAIRTGSCSACHNPHGGTAFRMLIEAYSAEIYAPYDEDRYALCFECHDVEMVEEERDDEVTGFRNGDLNLHYLHVSREVKGCTCRACHDAHAGKQPKLMVEAVPFGEGPVPMTFEATVTGGSCLTECHQAWAYDRVDPVRNE